jgi:pimeloyl-ACP methyl ester carboxylesterase
VAIETGKAAETGKAEPPPKPKLDTGLVTALAIGAAGIGGMIGGFVNAFLGLGLWMPMGVIGILLLISGPSMLLAWLKLRNRNLGPLLDANGWAVNARARVNVPFGASLTSVATLPPGAQRDLNDPYADEPGRPLGARLQLEARSHHDTWDRLSEISAPTLICAGRYDGIALPVTQERMAERIAGARLEFFEGGHLFMVQDRRAYQAIGEFLA